MSSATLTHPFEEDSRPLSAARRGMPWLLSTISHLTLLVVMAVLYQRQGGIGDSYLPTRGGSLTSVRLGTGGGKGEDSVEVARYFADDESNRLEDGQIVRAAAASRETIQLHPNGELASLSDEPPPVNFDEIVLSSATTPAQGNASSGGQVPNAADMIRGGSAAGGKGHGSGGGADDGAGPVGFGNALKNGAARTGVFGVSGVGYKFVYVFDRSGSMDSPAGTPLAAAKAELIRSLQQLDKVHQFQIIFYNEQPRVFTLAGNDGRLVFGTEPNKRLAERFVGGITADGATGHEPAITLALRMNPDVIFFLTDADEPAMSAKQLDRIVRINNGTTINTVQFGYGPQADSDNFLAKLARQNGGQHVYVDISDLPRP